MKTTNTDNNLKGRTLSDNDRTILTKSLTALHGVLKDYWVGEEGLPEHINLRSEKQVIAVLSRAADAFKVIREEERKAMYASLRQKITETTKPFIDAAGKAREAFLSLPPEALDMVKKSGMLSDEVRIPLALVVPHFTPGTTLEQIKLHCEAMGFKLAKGGAKGTFDLIIPLVVKEGPKPVPNASLAPSFPKDDSSDDVSEAATGSDK